MKKILNHPDSIVNDMIDGYIAAYSDYVSTPSNPRVVLRSHPKEKGKVAVVIGNGCGHEPIAMGWVGQGMLDANAVGDIFAAPPAELILEAIREADTGAGVLLLISRHAGDVINGEMAVELARMEGLKVEALLMYDDISSAPKGKEEDRRGAAGTAFIYKLVGARAEAGASLAELKALGEKVRDNTRSLAAALAPGISPLTGKAMFTLPEDEIYLGMGVHGEPGLKSIKIDTAKAIVTEMMDAILADLPFSAKDEVLVFINGMGSTTLMELFVIYKEVAEILKTHTIKAYKPLIGEYITTQEMAGFSISLCRSHDDFKQLWDAPVSVPYFHR